MEKEIESNDVQNDSGQGVNNEMKDIRWIESEFMNKTKLTNRKNNSTDDDNVDDDDDDDDESEVECFDLFADPDPKQVFTFRWTIEDTESEKDQSSRTSATAAAAAIIKTTTTKVIEIELIGVKAELGQTLHSTGLTLWRASELLCNFIIQERDRYVRNRTVLELGAGLGLCGILATKLGASSVILTDGDTDTLVNMIDNVQRNCYRNTIVKIDDNQNNNVIAEELEKNKIEQSEENDKIICQQLVWGYENHIQSTVVNHGKFDTIIGSDIIYVEEILDPLFSTVCQLLHSTESSSTYNNCNNNGYFLLSYARRNVSIDLVFATATKYNLRWEEPLNSEGVFVFQFDKIK